MGYFSNKLTQLLANRTQQPIADISGIARGTLSLYASGDRNISVGALEKLMLAFPDATERFELIRAHLQDEIPREQFNHVAIIPNGQEVHEERFRAEVYDKDMDAAIALLKLAARKDEDVRKVLLDLARVVR